MNVNSGPSIIPFANNVFTPNTLNHLLNPGLNQLQNSAINQSMMNQSHDEATDRTAIEAIEAIEELSENPSLPIIMNQNMRRSDYPGGITPIATSINGFMADSFDGQPCTGKTFMQTDLFTTVPQPVLLKVREAAKKIFLF